MWLLITSLLLLLAVPVCRCTEGNAQLLQGPLKSDEAWVWPTRETWLIEIGGLQQNDDEVCEDATASAGHVVETFCEEHGIGTPICYRIKQNVFVEAKKVKKGETALVPVGVDMAVDLTLSLRTPSKEKEHVTLRIRLDEEVKDKVDEFCTKYSLGDDSCESIFGQIKDQWDNQRKRVVSNLQARYASAVNGLGRIEAGEATWQEVSFTLNHLEQVLYVDRGNWRALFLLGGLYSQASSSERIAIHFRDKDGSRLLETCAKYYQRAADSHAVNVDSPDLVQLQDRAKIHHLAGTVWFHVDDIEKARENLYFSLELSDLVFTSASKEDVAEASRQSFKAAALQLATVEANTDRIEHAGKLFGRLCNEGFLSAEDCFSTQLFTTTLFPFVFNTSEDSLMLHRDTLLQLDRLKGELMVSPLPAERLHPYFGFYGVYAGSLAGAWMEKDTRLKLQEIHALASPSLLYISPFLAQGSHEESSSASSLERVGFISSYFYEHSVGKLLCNTIVGLLENDAPFEIVVIQVGNNPSIRGKAGSCQKLWELGSEKRKKAFKTFQLDFSLNLQGVAEAHTALAELNLDILVFGEIGLVASTYFLAYGRVAPVQLGFWGHPLTTGLSHSIDYMITSELFFPSQVEMVKPEEPIPLCPSNIHLLPNSSFIPFVESLICTQTLGTYFVAPREISEDELSEAKKLVENALIAANVSIAHDEVHLYYLPHKLMKIHPRMDEHLARVLELDPKAVLLLLCGEDVKEGAFSVFTWARLRLQARLERSGIPRNRMAWLPAMPLQVFLAVGRVARVTVESFGSFGSGVTALEFLSVGVPMVALPTRQRVTPNAHGFFRAIAQELDLGWVMEDLSCFDEECFSKTAVEFATNEALREKWFDMLNRKEVKDVLFSNPSVIQEWQKIIIGLYDNTKKRFHYLKKKEDSGDDDAESLLKHIDYSYENVVEKKSSKDEDMEEERFKYHSIQLKDNLKL